MDDDVLSDLSRFVEWEKNPKWTAISMAGICNGALNEYWLNALSGKNRVEKRVASLWADIADIMPRTKKAFESKIFGLSLLETNESTISLVYIFESDGELTVRRGYAPVIFLPPIAASFPIDLMPFYRVHDGLINLMSYDGGLLPVNHWRKIVIPGASEPSFIEIAVDGSEGFGFDISDLPYKAYIIRPEEDDIELVTDVWGYLDDLTACHIENL